MIAFGREITSDFAAASTREWLETNGIGGYASSTIAGAHTRRYHGLLVAATRPPLGRMVLLSKFEETVIIGGQRYELSCNQYPGKIHPEGYKHLVAFRLDPFPIWTFDLDGIEVERSILMIYGENSTVIRWSIMPNSAHPASNPALELRPLVAFRDHHHLRSEGPIDADVDIEPGIVSVTTGEDTRLYFAHSADSVEATGDWYRNFEYVIEKERGFDFREDLFQPFRMSFDLSHGAVVVASPSKRQTTDVDKLAESERQRRAGLVATAGASGSVTQQLVRAADQFIVSRGKGKTVIAGYHWFSDWGRDVMIALPGLTLATKRYDIARDILLEFSRHVSDGMLPNRFPDAGESPDYNTVDATLWYFEAVRGYLQAIDDHDVARELFPKLADIIDWHISGTRYRIRVDGDGLLYAGEPGVQLTWMDAKVGMRVITPRTGKAVEIQALWYNALCVMSDLAAGLGEDGDRYSGLAAKTKESFEAKFWHADANCLYDVIDGDIKDASIRPNQIFAVSLPHMMLSKARARAVVQKVEAELLTPFGLRSLSPRDPRYVGTYIGSPEARDSAYHQGTVWAWLIGPFMDAYRKVYSGESDVEKRVLGMVERFESHLEEAMAGQVSEIFDGDAPHAPRGAAAQAWSVAELLRVVIDAKPF
jgi:predicted glycogen debranching enzyme